MRIENLEMGLFFLTSSRSGVLPYFYGINSHIKPRIFRGFFYVKKLKNYALKINQKPIQNS
jgi:hypothetical protein